MIIRTLWRPNRSESAPALVKLGQGGSEQDHHEVVGILGAEVMVIDLGEAGGEFWSIL